MAILGLVSRVHVRTYIHTFIHTSAYIYINTHTSMHPAVFDFHISAHVYHVPISTYSLNRTAHTFTKMGSDGMQILIAGLGYTVLGKNISPAFYTCLAALIAKPLVTSGHLCNSYTFHEYPIFFPGPTVNLSVALLYAVYLS
jgi:hypothetical protein